MQTERRNLSPPDKQDTEKPAAILSESQALELSAACASDPAFYNRLDLTKTETIKKTLANCRYILENDAYLKGALYYDAFSGQIMIQNVFWELDAHPLRDHDIYRLNLFLEGVYETFGEATIIKAATIVAHDHSRHPVQECLNSLHWDGVPRLADLFPVYLGAERGAYTTAVTKLLLYGLIQRVFSPGCKLDTAVVLCDPRQGTGKSTMCRFLALKDEWFTDALGNLADSKTAFETTQGAWVVELGELLALRRSRDVEAIKAYLSRKADTYRQPYAKFSEVYPRQFCCIGTTNKTEFLPDDRTGNRRFLPLPCDGSRAEKHPLANEEETREYIRQCYAEAMVTGSAEGWPLTLPVELQSRVNELREAAMSEDDKLGIIEQWLEDYTGEYVCSGQIWREAFDRPDDQQPTKAELREISEIMTLQVKGWTRYKGPRGNQADAKWRFAEYGLQRAFVRVPEAVPEAVPESVPEAGEFVPIPEDIKLPFD